MNADNEDARWRRPPAASADEGSVDNGYTGPPPTLSPAADWQAPLVPPAAAPRILPVLDHEAIDAAEERASRLTYVLGACAAVLLGLALCMYRVL